MLCTCKGNRKRAPESPRPRKRGAGALNLTNAPPCPFALLISRSPGLPVYPPPPSPQVGGAAFVAYCEATATTGTGTVAESLSFVDAIKEKIDSLFGGDKGGQSPAAAAADPDEADVAEIIEGPDTSELELIDLDEVFLDMTWA